MKDPTNSVNRRILRAVLEFLLLSFVSSLVPLIVATDIRFFSTGFSEILLTELSQELLLGISAILFAIKAYQCPASRGFLTLVAGMFLTMLIRESDAYLDRWVYHSFWVWPACIVTFTAVSYATLKCGDTIWKPMSNFVDTKSHTYIMIGMITLLVLSRSLGSGELLWKHILGDNADTIMLKTALQEGLELYGYIFICYGSWLFRHEDTPNFSTPAA